MYVCITYAYLSRDGLGAHVLSELVVHGLSIEVFQSGVEPGERKRGLGLVCERETEIDKHRHTYAP